MSERRLKVITLGILLSLFLASMEGTVVATAMPTIVGQLGGLSIYSWVFAIYLLAGTTTVPIYGKLSDLYGRRRVFSAAMLLFLGGSILCGTAQTMEQLIFFRAVQGLGAGGVLPLAFTIVGELFSLEQRARLQGLFSGVWGVSSVIGPLIGGFLVDQASWHWVFLINIIPGSLALILVLLAWKGGVQRQVISGKVVVDYPGAALLTMGALALLLGLNELGSAAAIWLLAASAILFAALYLVERRTADPILPLGLFRDRLFAASLAHGLFSGWAMFGSINYVPLFVQAVLGTSATEAGIALAPMSLSWTFASILGARLLLKIGYRTLALVGMVFLVAGTYLMSTIGSQSSELLIMLYLGLMGTGMGVSVPAFLIAVQSTVRKDALGTATSTLQFARNIGGTLGVSILGAFLSAHLSERLLAASIDPATVSLESLLDPVASASQALSGPLRGALAVSIASLFVIAFGVAVLGLFSVLLAPGGKIATLMQQKNLDLPPEIQN